MHPHAEPASLAALAADRQGRYWDMHNLLFEHRRDLPQLAAASEVPFEELVSEMGLEMGAYRRDVASEQVRAIFDGDAEDARRHGIRSTPSLFIAGTRYRGERSAAAIGRAIEEALGG